MSIVYYKYMSLLNRRPLMTKCLTSAFLVGVGDSICQGIEHSKCTLVLFLLICQRQNQILKDLIYILIIFNIEMTGKKEYDYKRTLNFMSYGLCFNGPALHLTYSRLLPTFAKGNDLRALGKKLLFT